MQRSLDFGTVAFTCLHTFANVYNEIRSIWFVCRLFGTCARTFWFICEENHIYLSCLLLLPRGKVFTRTGIDGKPSNLHPSSHDPGDNQKLYHLGKITSHILLKLWGQ